MKPCLNLYFFISVSLITTSALAESDSTDTLDPVVVTATRSETKESDTGNTVTVITADEIKSRRINSVAEILKVVPGVDVISEGGPGQHTSVFTRGANSNQTLVLIDNIVMNDPGSVNGAFDFANLQIDNIERIEILRGAASSMWGADAMGGVIHIITKHGAGKPQFNGLAEGGNYATWKLGGGLSGSEGRLNYTINASHLSTVGVSSAAASMGNPERDPYQNTTVQARTNYQLTDDLDLDWTLRYNNGQVGLDNCSGPSCDNPYYWQNTNEIYTRGQARLFLFDRKWEQRFGVNYSQTDRQTTYSNDEAAANIPSTAIQPISNFGSQIKVEWMNFIRISELDTVTAGIDGKFNSMSSTSGSFNCPADSPAGVCLDPATDYWMPYPIPTSVPSSSYSGSMNNGGFYLQNDLDWLDRFHTTVGGRLDTNSLFANHLTWRLNQVIGIPELSNRIKANIGTAFTPPSLCNLSPSCYGTPGLQPETSVDWDAGIEQDLLNKQVKLGVLYFHNDYYNLIQWVANENPPNYGNLVNVSNATAEGIESFFEYKPMDSLSLRLNYTFDQTRGAWENGVQTNQPLLNRPKNKGNFDLDYKLTEKASTHLNILAFGARDTPNMWNSSGVSQVAGYVLVNLSANYEISDQVTLFAKMNNLLNKSYEQVWGYGTLGFNGMGGVSVKY